LRARRRQRRSQRSENNISFLGIYPYFMYGREYLIQAPHISGFKIPSLLSTPAIILERPVTAAPLRSAEWDKPDLSHSPCSAAQTQSSAGLKKRVILLR
jgi:hypothetical protein